MYQADQSSLKVAIPEVPFRAFKFGQCMAANPIICYRVYTFGELQQVRELHSRMEPIQHVLSTSSTDAKHAL
jgi:hypothetical protein